MLRAAAGVIVEVSGISESTAEGRPNEDSDNGNVKKCGKVTPASSSASEVGTCSRGGLQCT